MSTSDRLRRVSLFDNTEQRLNGDRFIRRVKVYGNVLAAVNADVAGIALSQSAGSSSRVDWDRVVGELWLGDRYSFEEQEKDLLANLTQQRQQAAAGVQQSISLGPEPLTVHNVRLGTPVAVTIESIQFMLDAMTPAGGQVAATAGVSAQLYKVLFQFRDPQMSCLLMLHSTVRC